MPGHEPPGTRAPGTSPAAPPALPLAHTPAPRCRRGSRRTCPPLPRPGQQKSPTPARIQAPAPVPKRAGRRSSSGLRRRVTRIAAIEGTRAQRTSATNEMRKRVRASRPGPGRDGAGGADHRIATGKRSKRGRRNRWTGDDVDDSDLQHTRIGTPAYQEGATRASGRPAAMPPVLAPLVMSQAVRVVVWRGADGVHVAPAGTQVAAIGVEAVLVALDPVADLAAWLSNK